MTRFKYLRKQNIKDIKKKEKEYIKQKSKITKMNHIHNQSFLKNDVQ